MRGKILLAAIVSLSLAGLWGCTFTSGGGGITAVIRANPDHGRSPLQVTFDASSSQDPAGPIQEYLWDFGDNSEVVTGVRVTHTYQHSGSYLVTLVVTGPSGVGRATVWIHVDNTPPVASFTFWPPDPFRGEEIQFDATASTDVDGEIVSWEWDFGDGSSAEGSTVSHAYASGGTYTVTLTVTDDNGAQDSITKEIEVSSCPGGHCGR